MNLTFILKSIRSSFECFLSNGQICVLEGFSTDMENELWEGRKKMKIDQPKGYYSKPVF
jgi:hypothetical protein